MARLILNGGSSSWKCGVYDVAADARAADASDSLASVHLSWEDANDDAVTIETRDVHGRSAQHGARAPHADPIDAILDAFEHAGVDLHALEAVGHRIVHGANDFVATTWLENGVVEKLRTLEPFAPSHNPAELTAVAAIRQRLPNVRQYAVFDTQFHRTLAPAAFTYAGPYAWLERGIRKYGFHGSSVAYATERVAASLDRGLDETNVIVAHLGGGCSVTAVVGGRSADTSMGLTPLDGTMMATRSGAIDPSIATFLARDEAKPGASTDRRKNGPGAGGELVEFADAFDRTLNHESGLAGISGRAGDLRAVRKASDAGDPRARLAVEMFVRRLTATIASYLPLFDRLDALVFTGGIGEHDAKTREATCTKLGYAGIALDGAANEACAADGSIGDVGAAVKTFVVTTREEWYVAREGARLAP